jgi:hypothetical protein
MWGHLQFKYEVLNCITPNWITLNWTMRSQTTASIAKSSCEISALLRYEVMMVIPYGRFRTTYWSNFQESRNPKEQSTSEVN